MTEATYTHRRIEKHTLKRIDGKALVSTEGWGSGAPQEVLDAIKVGDEYELELMNFNTIAGYRIGGVWISRLSDQELKKRDDDMIEESRRKHVEFIDSHKEEYDQMEAELPEWAKKVLEKNRLAMEERGEDFHYAYMGRAYTLIALKLAVLYSEIGDVLKDTTVPLKEEQIPDNIKEFWDNYGTSGNQDSWAMFIAHGYLNGKLDD